MSSDSIDFVLTTGGTGGHIMPCKAIFEELALKGYSVKVFGGEEIIRYDFSKDKHTIIPSSKIPYSIKGASTIICSTFKAINILIRHRPKAVLAFGSYASFPTCLAALILFIPLILHEQNVLAGQVNRIMSRFAKKIIISFPDTKGFSTKVLKKSTVIGNPIRQCIIHARDKTYVPSLNNDEFRLFVVGGSGGANFFTRSIYAVIQKLNPELQKRLKLVQQCKESDIENLRAIYENMNINYEISPFFSDISDRLANAHLIISRAGASTIAELVVVNRPSILIPFPYDKDNHQIFNAEYLQDLGMARVVMEDDFNVDRFVELLSSLMSNSKLLEDMISLDHDNIVKNFIYAKDRIVCLLEDISH